MTLQATTDLTNATAQTIAKANVLMMTDTMALAAGLCTTGVGTTSWTSIGNGIGHAILSKTAALGQICKVTADNIKLAVEVPANQPVGFYTGTLSLDAPY